MNHFYAAIRRHWHKGSQVSLLGLALVTLGLTLGGCKVDPVDAAIDQIDKTTLAITAESSGWRDELPKLVTALNGLESQATADTKDIVAGTVNQVQDLSNQTIQLSDAKAQDLISQAGVEFRCNADFVKAGVLAQLQYLKEDLQFWKQNKKHSDKKPNHAVCWVNPTVLYLYTSGDRLAIDPSNMSDKGIVHVFGYSFWSEKLPTLEFQNTNGVKIRNVNLAAAYVTHYELNLDFSNENFDKVDPTKGDRVVFKWPDESESNTITLHKQDPAKLQISNPVFTPSAPTAQTDSVSLKVRVTNQGEARSGGFVINWKPDPNDPKVLSVSRTPLNGKEGVDVSFPPYVYQRGGGTINSTVSISTGDDSKTYPLAVAAPPPLPPVVISSAPCPVPISTISLPTPPGSGEMNLSDGDRIRVEYARNLPYNQIKIVLQTASKVTSWKGLQLQSSIGTVLGTNETQDANHGPVSMSLVLAPGQAIRLILQKAKFLQAHTDMYCAGDLTLLPEYTVTFTWLQD